MSRGRRQVLAGVDLRLAAGEVMGLMGRNGAGKSTLIACLLGFVPPAAGSLSILGARLPGVARSLYRHVGVAFQSPSLDRTLTAEENLRLGGRLCGLDAQTAAARARALLAEVGLSARASERVATLSGGMNRRLELARALVHRPRLLLLDEAAGGLDPAALADFWTLVRRLAAEEQVGVLAATHLPDEAARCDRLVVLDGGTVVADDTVDRLIAAFGGDLVALTTPEPAAVAAELTLKLGLAPWLQAGQVLMQDPQAHRLVPRLVEVLGAARVQGVEVRAPTLGDVFFRRTGRDMAPGEPG